MPTRVSHYEVLGVPPGSNDRELKAAYRRKAKALHPDSGGSDADFEALQVAWKVLSDPDRRHEYDAWLRDTRQVSGGTTTRIQQRFEESEREADRRAWEVRRSDARRRAAARAAEEAAAQERRRRVDADIGLHRTLTIAAGALVVLVSVLELLDGEPLGVVELFGASFELPPTTPAMAVVQMGVAAALVGASLLSRAPQSDPSGAFERFVSSGTYRIAVGLASAVLAIWVVVPFVLLTLSNAVLVLVAGALLVGLVLARRN